MVWNGTYSLSEGFNGLHCNLQPHPQIIWFLFPSLSFVMSHVNVQSFSLWDCDPPKNMVILFVFPLEIFPGLFLVSYMSLAFWELWALHSPLRLKLVVCQVVETLMCTITWAFKRRDIPQCDSSDRPWTIVICLTQICLF